MVSDLDGEKIEIAADASECERLCWWAALPVLEHKH